MMSLTSSSPGMLLSLAIFSLTCVADISFGAAPLTEVEVFALERHIIETRKSIRSGHFVIETRYPAYHGMAEVERRATTYVIDLEDEKIRCNYDAVSEFQRMSHQIISTTDTLIRNSEASDNCQVFTFAPREHFSELDVQDPRKIGLSVAVFDSIGGSEFEAILGNASKKITNVAEGVEESEPVWKVYFEYPNGDHGEYWLAKNKDNLPIYVERNVRRDEIQYKNTIRTTLRKWPNDDVWFPSENITQGTKSDKLEYEEILTVKEAVLNGDIPDYTFTLEGLGLPNGRVVDIDGKRKHWDAFQRSLHP